MRATASGQAEPDGAEADSAIAISYTRHRPFDREVFSRFDDYLRNPLPPPSVILSRVRIAKRHLHAHLLGSFMQLVQPGNVTGRNAGLGNAWGPFTAQPSVPILGHKRETAWAVGPFFWST